MEAVYEIAIIIWVVFIFWFSIDCSGGWKSFKPPRDENERKRQEEQKKHNIEQVKKQEKYDNDWGYIKK